MRLSVFFLLLDGSLNPRVPSLLKREREKKRGKTWKYIGLDQRSLRVLNLYDHPSLVVCFLLITVPFGQERSVSYRGFLSLKIIMK